MARCTPRLVARHTDRMAAVLPGPRRLGRAGAVIVFLAWSAIHNAAENLARAKIASGFGFWDNTAGFDISQTLIDYIDDIELRPRVLGRPAQHAAGRRPRHRARDHPRLPHRHRAAVEQLARRQALHRLCRDHPQHPAAAAAAVLVQRRAQGAARDAREPGDPGRRISQQPRPVPAGAGVSARLVAWRWRVARARASSVLSPAIAGRRRRQMATGQQAPVLWVTLGLVIALPLDRAGAVARSRSAFSWPEARRLQLRGRIADEPRTRRPDHGAVDLYGGLYRRDRARRAGVGGARPARGGRRSASGAACRCGWSSSRRRCA